MGCCWLGVDGIYFDFCGSVEIYWYVSAVRSDN